MKRWRNTIYFLCLITILFNAQKLEGKLVLEHSPKSSEMLSSNAIYSSKNNEITETEQLNGNSNDNKEEMGKEVVENEIEIEEVTAEAEVATETAAARTTMRSSSTLLEQHELEVVNLDDVEGKQGEQENKNKLLAYQIENENKENEIKIKKITVERPQPKLIRKNVNENTSLNVKKKTKKIATTTTKSPATAAIVSGSNTNLKSQLPSSFINPFGQLSALFGGDQLHHQLQDYNFLFNAERHTIFQLHTVIGSSSISSSSSSSNGNGNSNSVTLSSGRVLNVVVGNSLSAAFGVNPTQTVGMPPSKVEEIQLYNAASLRQSQFNPFNPTRILIHGWFGGSHAGVYNTLVPEYLKLANGSLNIFTVDWGRGAIADYITASYRVKPVGKTVAKFIDFLHRESGMRFEDLHVIGFSMGAHIAGIAGKHVQSGRLPIIYALDPALPLFRYENIDERIALTDADYVEVIHTSVGSYGYDRPLGHVDFYVNYGSGQPGCFFNECSHFRAFQLLAESLHAPEAFRGQGCDVKLWLDLIKNRRCLMGTGRNLTMGGNPTDAMAVRKRGGGVFYVATNANSPFAKS